MRKFFTLPFFVALVSSCGTGDLDYYEGRSGAWTPRPMYLSEMPLGSDPYSQGMRDGCNTSLSTLSLGLVRSNYNDIYLDVDRTTKDDDYSKGWTMGHNYCTYFTDPDPI